MLETLAAPPDPVTRDEWQVADRPAGAPDAGAIDGYPGRSARPEFLRLYLDRDFRSHVEIPRSSILHGDPGDPAAATGPIRVVVAPGTPLDVIQAGDDSFLGGSITSTYPVAIPGGARTSTTDAGEIVGRGPHETAEHEFEPGIHETEPDEEQPTHETEAHEVPTRETEPDEERPTHETSEHEPPSSP